MRCSTLVRHQGFSLVELMVALVIGLLITLGAFQLFLVGKNSFDHSLALAERQSSLRFLVDSISYDIRSASYAEFIDGEGTILSNSTELVLSFERESDICPGDETYQVKYFAEGGEIKVAHGCEGADLGGGLAIVLGVGSITFGYLSSGLGMKVEVEMEDDRGRLLPEIFEFQVANRSAVGRALRLWDFEDEDDSPVDDDDGIDDNETETGGQHE